MDCRACGYNQDKDKWGTIEASSSDGNSYLIFKECMVSKDYKIVHRGSVVLYVCPICGTIRAGY